MTERTFVLLKPDAVERHLVGRILSRFEDKGLQIVGMKLMKVSEYKAQQHYQEHRSQDYYDGLCQFLISGPVVALTLQGPDAITTCRKLIGAYAVLEPGTIRGDLAYSVRQNLVHGSDGPEAAEREIDLFFGGLDA